MQLSIEPATSTGNAVVRHYRTGAVFEVAWHDGLLSNVEPKTVTDPLDQWIAPALTDLQVNGYAGVDFQRIENASHEALIHASREMAASGCGRFFLTLITCPWDDMLEKVRRYRTVIRSSADLRRSIPGWHIEGPFLSEKPGFVGAHDPACITDPTPDHLRRLKEAVGEDPVLLTLAPERPGSAAIIREARRLGFVVSLGHTDASTAELAAAHEAGAGSFTHLANGCPQLLDRHDNLLWRVLDGPPLHVGVIADGIHVSPSLFRIIHRQLPGSRIWWTTDAMSAAGAPAGIHTLGPASFEVGADGIVRNPATGGFAGSSLTPIEGVRRGCEMLGIPWQAGWDHFSTVPAGLMGLPSDLAPGSAAGFHILRQSQQ